MVGSGATLRFWEDPWLQGLSVAAIAPAVLRLVRPSCIKRRTVRDAVLLNAWALDITGELTVDAVVQYLKLWSAVASVQLGVGEDTFRWKWTADGVFSVRLAYRAFFHGTTALPGAAHVWHSFAPFKHRFHAWLSLRRRCWTADRRLRRGWDQRHRRSEVEGGLLSGAGTDGVGTVGGQEIDGGEPQPGTDGGGEPQPGTDGDGESDRSARTRMEIVARSSTRAPSSPPSSR
ncbi:hypothetical protein ACQ4PT_030381 [Festuca glaucescens]